MSSANQAPLKSSYILSHNLLTSFLEPVSCPSHSYCSFHSISQFNQELPMWEIPQMFHWSSHKWDLSDLGCFEKISDVLNDCVINLWKSILKLFSIFLWDTQSPPTSTRSPRQSTHSLWVPKLLCLRLSPILIGCLLSSSLLQFAKFKELLLFILLAFARSDSAWFLLFSPLYASWLLRQSFSLFICYLFSPPFLVGSWSILWQLFIQWGLDILDILPTTFFLLLACRVVMALASSTWKTSRPPPHPVPQLSLLTSSLRLSEFVVCFFFNPQA